MSAVDDKECVAAVDHGVQSGQMWNGQGGLWYFEVACSYNVMCVWIRGGRFV